MQTATAIFSYNGYGAAVYFSEETRNAARGIARAIMWSLAITVAAELIPMTEVILGAPDIGKLISDPAPMEYFVTARGGSTLNTIVSLAIALAIINAVVAITLQAGRMLYGSARDRAYPDAISRAFAYVHPRLLTPVPATLFVGGAAAIVAAIVPIGSLITATGGYAYYYAYLYPQRATRWTMPAAAHDEHAQDEAGGVLMGPVLEIKPPGVQETGV